MCIRIAPSLYHVCSSCTYFKSNVCLSRFRFRGWDEWGFDYISFCSLPFLHFNITKCHTLTNTLQLNIYTCHLRLSKCTFIIRLKCSYAVNNPIRIKLKFLLVHQQKVASLYVILAILKFSMFQLYRILLAFCKLLLQSQFLREALVCLFPVTKCGNYRWWTPSLEN